MAHTLTPFTAFDGLTRLLFSSAILPICWTEASAAWAPPPTPQGKWKACRPPRPATPLSLVCRICRQSEDGTDRSLSPGKLFGSPAAALRGLVSKWGGGGGVQQLHTERSRCWQDGLRTPNTAAIRGSQRRSWLYCRGPPSVE